MNKKQLGIFLGPILKNIMELDKLGVLDDKLVSLLRTWKYSLKQFGGFEHVLPFLDLSLYENSSELSSGWWDAMAMAIMIALKSSLGIRIMAFDSEPIWIAFEDFQNTDDEPLFFSNTLAMFRKVLTVAIQRKERKESRVSLVLKDEHSKIKNIFSVAYNASEIPHMVYWNVGAVNTSDENPFCVKTWSVRNIELPEFTLFAGGSSCLLKYLGTLSCFEWKQLTSFELLSRILNRFPLVL